MNKILGIALFAVLIAGFIGAVAATPSIDTNFTDENGTTIDEAQIGDNVTYNVNVQNGEKKSYKNDVKVQLDTDHVNWDANLSNVQVSYNGGESFIAPSGEVVFTTPNTIDWYIGSMYKNELAIMKLSGVLLGFTDDRTVGYITNEADLFSANKCKHKCHSSCDPCHSSCDPKWVGEDISTIVVDPATPFVPASGEPEGSNVAAAGGESTVSAAAGTVPLEATGLPVGLALFAVSLVGAGLAYARRR